MKFFRVLLAVAMLVGTADACTSIVVSRGASKDGSVMITYSADAPFMPRLLRIPGGVPLGRRRWWRSGAGKTTRSAAR